MRLTRLGRATVIGILVSGAFALGQAWETWCEAPTEAQRNESAPPRVLWIPGSKIQVSDLTGTAELCPLPGVEGVAVTWVGGGGRSLMTVTPDWGTHALQWGPDHLEQRTEVGQYQDVYVVLDEGTTPVVVRPAPGPF